LDDNSFKENFAYISTWAAYEYSARDITILIKKSAYFLLQYFSDIYICLFNNKILLIFPLQTIFTNSSLKKKKKRKFNKIVILAVIKMPKAKLCHLSLDFSTLHKLNPFYYCDATNYSTSSINTGSIVILAYGYIYYKICYDNNGFKCLHCFLFLQDGVDEYVQSLLI